MKKITIFKSLLVGILLLGCSGVFAAVNNGQADAINRSVALFCNGEFEQAKDIISGIDAQAAEPMRAIIAEYEELQARRKKAREDKYLERFQELEEIIAKDFPENDPNYTTEAYVALIGCRQYATDEQKEQLLTSEFAEKLLKETISQSITYEAEGKWDKAYTNYYWISSLYEDNKAYEKKAETLLDKIAVEASLTDSPCEDSSARFDGISPVMLVRAIKMLDFGYVDLIDYEAMAHKALDRCIILAEVMSFEKEEFEIEFSRSHLQNWIAGVRKIKNELGQGPLARLNHKDFLDSFLMVLALNEQTINIASEIIVSHFSEAALSTLDPYTNIVWPFYTKEFEKSITQQFSGIGVEISKATGELTVMSLLPGTPAYNSGLDAEDVIVEVDGISTRDMTINCAVSMITGPDGTSVTLTVRGKNTDHTRKITIKRANIVVPTVRGWQRTANAGWRYMLDEENGIGYVRITGFTGTTAQYMKDAVSQLEKEGVKALIVDLRFNSGGLLQTAGEIVDMFVDKGLIVSTRPRWGFGEELKATKKATIPNYPMVVLINGGSASASEIVAGALQDEKYKRATLVGNRTYGKGSVQTISDTPGGGAQLKYTMAFYHLPSGQPVKNRYQLKKQDRDDWGVSPDVMVELTPEESKSYINLQKDNDVLVKADHDYTTNEVIRHSEAETIASDPQLATALLVARAKMIANK